MKYRVASAVVVGLLAWRLKVLSARLYDEEHQRLKDDCLEDLGGDEDFLDFKGRDIVGFG